MSKSKKINKLRVWTCVDHAFVEPTGGASVVVAETEDDAAELLAEELAKRGLYGGFSLQELDLSEPGAMVLCDGDY